MYQLLFVMKMSQCIWRFPKIGLPPVIHFHQIFHEINLHQNSQLYQALLCGRAAKSSISDLTAGIPLGHLMGIIVIMVIVVVIDAK